MRENDCPQCGYENHPNAFGCLNCGHILQKAEVAVCPECGYENTKGMLECLNCGRALTEAETAETGDVELLTIDDPELAASVQDKLAAEGLDFYFHNDPCTSGTAIRVPAEQAPRARDVLSDLLNPPKPRYCPQCNKRYRPEDYDPLVPLHLCTRCGEELPR